MVACEPKLPVWRYGEQILPFPLLAIFSPFPQTESLFTGYQMEAFEEYFSHVTMDKRMPSPLRHLLVKHETK